MGTSTIDSGPCDGYAAGRMRDLLTALDAFLEEHRRAGSYNGWREAQEAGGMTLQISLRMFLTGNIGCPPKRLGPFTASRAFAA